MPANRCERAVEAMIWTKEETAENAESAERVILYILCVLCVLCGFFRTAQAQLSTPIIVVETSKGTFAFETYPEEAPKTVAHVVELVKQGFYDGQRIHRAVPGFVVQHADAHRRCGRDGASWFALARRQPDLCDAGEPARFELQVHRLRAGH